MYVSRRLLSDKKYFECSISKNHALEIPSTYSHTANQAKQKRQKQKLQKVSNLKSMCPMQIGTTVQQTNSMHDKSCFALSHVQEILERKPKRVVKISPSHVVRQELSNCVRMPDMCNDHSHLWLHSLEVAPLTEVPWTKPQVYEVNPPKGGFGLKRFTSGTGMVPAVDFIVGRCKV